MDDFKGKISKEVLDSLTMEDLWKSPGLKNYVEKNYPRAYLAITEPWREFGLYSFIKIAEEQKQFVKKAMDVTPITESPKRDLKFALEVIRQNKLGKGTELWLGGVPFKFELSRFVKHYANERTYGEWRKILNDIGATKSNIDRILERYKNNFKE